MKKRKRGLPSGRVNWLARPRVSRRGTRARVPSFLCARSEETLARSIRLARERDKREKACTHACKALLLLFFSVSSSSPGKKGGRSKASPPPRSSSAEGFLRSFSRLVGRERCLRWHISDDSCRGFEVQETGKRAKRGGKGERMRVRVPSQWGHSCVAFKGERGKESTTFPRRHASPSALLAAASKACTSLVH